MRKSLLFTIFLISTHLSFSQQNSFNATIEAKGLYGNGKTLPFWLTHNQLGKYTSSSNLKLVTEGNLSGSFLLYNKKIKLSYGTELLFCGSENKDNVKIIQAYAGLSWRNISLKAGTFADEEVLGGLSTSNGNIIRSLNYRPYPKVSLSTNGYITIPFVEKMFRFKAEYEEGILEDNRRIRHPHINHGMFGAQVLANSTLRFSFEINRYIFWGGFSQQYGQMPGGFKNYIRYVLGLKGGSDFLETDQLNVAGNQLGSYLFTVEKEVGDYHMELRVSHPFEDGSGMMFYNFKDNLYSFYVRKASGSLIDEFLFEYLYSKNQSGNPCSISDKWKLPYGGDNYFNHGVYGSGFTYLGYSMGTPLFTPVEKNAHGITTGFKNNRVSAFHTGAKGYLSKQISWKAMLTYSRNFGTYSNHPNNPVNRQIYSLLQVSWRSKALPLTISTIAAADFGSMAKKQFGLGLSFKWEL